MMVSDVIHKVTVLLSSYNGEKYIQEQITSIKNQESVDVRIFVRDDGSTDNTLSILSELKDDKTLKIMQGRNLGIVGSFFELLKAADDSELYAFSDQDDVWDSDKLKAAAEMLHIYNNVPALYFSVTQPVDSLLQPLPDNMDASEKRVYTIHEILLRNNAAGCTMVINQNLKELVLRKLPGRIIMHDQWIYAVCLAVGGKVIFDPNPHIKYRQHSSNAVGYKINLLKRIRYSSFYRYKQIRSQMAQELLTVYGNDMDNGTKEIIRQHAEYMQSLKSKFSLIFSEIEYAKGFKNKLLFCIQVLLNLY